MAPRHGQVPGVTPNETRDPDGTGRIVKFGPDRVEAGHGWRQRGCSVFLVGFSCLDVCLGKNGIVEWMTLDDLTMFSGKVSCEN